MPSKKLKFLNGYKSRYYLKQGVVIAFTFICTKGGEIHTGVCFPDCVILL